MTVTLNLPPEVEQAFRDEAQAKGVPVDELVQEVLVKHRPEPIPTGYPTRSGCAGSMPSSRATRITPLSCPMRLWNGSPSTAIMAGDASRYPC